MTRNFQHADYGDQDDISESFLTAKQGQPSGSRNRSVGRYGGRLMAAAIGPSTTSKDKVERTTVTYKRDPTGLVVMSAMGTIIPAMPIGTRIRVSAYTDPTGLSGEDPLAIEGVFRIINHSGVTITYQDTRTSPVYYGTEGLQAFLEVYSLNHCSMSSWQTYISMFSNGSIRFLDQVSMGGSNHTYLLSHMHQLADNAKIDIVFIDTGSFGLSITNQLQATADTCKAAFLRAVRYMLSKGKIVVAGTTPATLTAISAPNYVTGRELVWWELKTASMKMPGFYLANLERALIDPANVNGFMDPDFCIDGQIHWNSEGAKMVAWEFWSAIAHIVTPLNKVLGFSTKDNIYTSGAAGNTNICRGWYNIGTGAIGVSGGSGQIPNGTSVTSTGGTIVSSVAAIGTTPDSIDADRWSMSFAFAGAQTYVIGITGAANEIAGQLTPAFWEACMQVAFGVSGQNVIASFEMWFEATTDGTNRVYSAAFLNQGSGADATNIQSGLAGPIYFPTFEVPVGSVASAARFVIQIITNAAGTCTLDIDGHFRMEIDRTLT